MQNSSHVDPLYPRGSVLLGLSFLSAMMVHLLLFSYGPLIPAIVGSLNINYTEAGVIFSASIIALIIARIPIGIVTDKVGPITTMKVSMIIMTASALGRGVATNFLGLLATQVVMGIGFAAVTPCLAKIVNEAFHGRPGTATGFYTMGFPMGEIVGLLIVAQLLPLSGSWLHVFQILGVVSLVVAILWWFLTRSVPLRARRADNSSPSWREFYGNKQLWFLVLICICSMGCYDTLLTWVPSFFETLGWTAAEASIATMMLPLGFILTGPATGILSDHWGARKPFVRLWAVLGGVVTFFAFLVSYPWQLLLLFLAGFTLPGVLTLVFIIPTEHPDFQKNVGGAVGLVSSLGNMGSFGFPIMVGVLLDLFGTPYLSTTLLAALAFLSLIWVVPIREPKGAREGPH